MTNENDPNDDTAEMKRKPKVPYARLRLRGPDGGIHETILALDADVPSEIVAVQLHDFLQRTAHVARQLWVPPAPFRAGHSAAGDSLGTSKEG